MSTTAPKIALYDPSGSGGITHYTFELAEGLATIGCRVTIITIEDYELRDLRRPFDVWFLFKRSRVNAWLSRVTQSSRPRTNRQEQPSPSDPPPARRRQLATWLRAQLKTPWFVMRLFKAAVILALNGTDVVHVQWIAHRKADLWFLRLLRALRIPIVYTVHDLMPHDEHTAANREFYQRLYRCADRLIVHSERIRREMLELFDVDAAAISVIPMGGLTVFFDHFGTSRTRAREELGLPDKARVILFFGLIKRYKGLEVLLRAFETIAARCDDAILLIAGRIADHDPDSHRHHVRLLARYSGHPRVRFTDEYVPLHSVAHYFTAADLVVAPYTKASQSAVLLTAVAAGTPVVVTDTGGLSDVVRHGANGYIVPPEDSDALAEASIRILEDPQLAGQFALEARRLVSTTYSWTSIGRTTVELYRALLDGPDSVPLSGGGETPAGAP